MLSRLPVHMQNRHTVQIRFRNNVSAKDPPFQSRFDFNIEIEIRRLRFLIITLGMSLHFNHIASCRKSRYHCPCHKSDKKASRHTLLQETARGLLFQRFCMLTTFSSSATHSRWLDSLMNNLFNTYCTREWWNTNFHLKMGISNRYEC